MKITKAFSFTITIVMLIILACNNSPAPDKSSNQKVSDSTFVNKDINSKKDSNIPSLINEKDSSEIINLIHEQEKIKHNQTCNR